MPETVITPQQIALFVAIPIDEDGFRAASKRGSDYLMMAPNIDWDSYYQGTAKIVCKELEELEETFGISVVRNATLKDFAKQIQLFPIIAVIAHMNFPLVEPYDIIKPKELCFLVENGTEPEWVMIREAMISEKYSQPFKVQNVVEVINRLIEKTMEGWTLQSEDSVFVKLIRILDSMIPLFGCKSNLHGDTQPLYDKKRFGLLGFDRPRLDELCGSTILREGKGIELTEGMISARQFIEAIPIDYSGFIDLRMCNSISLGAAIRRARTSVNIAVGRDKKDVLSALVIFKTVFKCMVEQARRGNHVSYEEVMMSLAEVK
ncbi:MAG: hypothetical protein SFH39_11755 [Candidatus Magnetobacterium sp. LHC-1]